MGIATGDNVADVIAYDQTHGIEYPSISGVDGGTAICNDYGIGAYPTYILIAPNGDIVEQDMWPISSANDLINPISGHGVAANPCGASSAADLLTFSLTEQASPATIMANTVDIDLVTNTAQDALVPTFSISSGAWATINGVTQTSGTTAVDFTSGSVTYTINAEDSITTQDWIVSVHNGLSIQPVESNLPAIYPNPASDVINITNASKLTIINSLGQIVRSIENETQVNVQDLNNGIYTVQIENNYQITKEILIINR